MPWPDALPNTVERALVAANMHPVQRAASTAVGLITLTSVLTGEVQADSAAMAVSVDPTQQKLKISGRSRGRTFELRLTTGTLKPGNRSTPAPLGCDCEWRDGSHQIVRAATLTLNGRTNKVQYKYLAPVAALHLAEVHAAVSTNGRRLFVCGALGDGAGAALALWSFSLRGTDDWLRAGELISEWDAPSFASADDCRAMGESAAGRTGTQRWPILIR